VKKTNYYLGIIFISLSVFLWLSFSVIAKKIKAKEVEPATSKAKSDEVIFETTCEESFGIYSSRIERWWTLECDDTIKAWDTETGTCERRKKGKAQADCKAQTNEKYYSLLKGLANRKELKVQKAEETYSKCQAQKGLPDLGEDIKK